MLLRHMVVMMELLLLLSCLTTLITADTIRIN